MTTQSTLAPAARQTKRSRATPVSAGLPDPRPLTDYDVSYDETLGISRITIKLAQPCVIREPQWSFIDCDTGAAMQAPVVKSVGSDTIVFEFAGIIATSVAFVDVPYQDMQVQNFQGGFVSPGGKWFRAPK